MTKTEELKKRLSDVSTENGGRNGNVKSFLSPYEIKQILKACKESGLKFTRTGVRGDDLEGACVCQVEEIDVITHR